MCIYHILSLSLQEKLNDLRLFKVLCRQEFWCWFLLFFIMVFLVA